MVWLYKVPIMDCLLIRQEQFAQSSFIYLAHKTKSYDGNKTHGELRMNVNMNYSSKFKNLKQSPKHKTHVSSK